MRRGVHAESGGDLVDRFRGGAGLVEEPGNELAADAGLFLRHPYPLSQVAGVRAGGELVHHPPHPVDPGSQQGRVLDVGNLQEAFPDDAEIQPHGRDQRLGRDAGAGPLGPEVPGEAKEGLRLGFRTGLLPGPFALFVAAQAVDQPPEGFPGGDFKVTGTDLLLRVFGYFQDPRGEDFGQGLNPPMEQFHQFGPAQGVARRTKIVHFHILDTDLRDALLVIWVNCAGRMRESSRVSAVTLSRHHSGRTADSIPSALWEKPWQATPPRS